MEEEALISVIVPVYNVEAYLPRCLDSIANQTYRNLEIILVDDGSTDGSGRICDEYATKDQRARVIHQTNKGLWAARNAGQDAANGEFLFFPDADDYFHHDIIRLLSESINFYGNEYSVAISLFKMTSMLDEDTLCHCNPLRSIVSRDQLMNRLFTSEFLTYAVNWNKLYRKSHLPRPFQRDYSRGQDFDSNIRLFLQIEEAIIVENALYFYYQHSNQVTKAPDALRNGYKCEIEILYSNYIELSGENKKYSHLFLCRLYRKMAQLKARSIKATDKDAIFSRCKNIFSLTISDFLLEKKTPTRNKVIYLIAFHSPYLTCFLLSLFDRYPSLFKFLSQQ